ncbi:MAG: YraN family protein [Pyrinomonadaceae bacterium]|nr:YraN family protein [Pyrinomonadaceae bacterium]MCX7638883.1 YraN family protein [Pyrinomonadaceae bacterium]MDW8304980.1 YraN family protein [Acidobacteriota bacterium]
MTLTEDLGKIGEQIAYEHLRKQGYRVVCANFKVVVGRNRQGATVTAEIDLVAYDEDYLCFIEVKTRKSEDFASPLTAIDVRKQRQIIRAAKMYRKLMGLKDVKFRYDAVSIVLNPKLEIKLIKDFFSEDKFKKKRWLGC